MKIGVDARSLTRPRTGIGRYTLEMCRALSRVDSVDLCLYSPDYIRQEYLDILDAHRVRSGNISNGFLRQIWSEYHLPLWVKEDNLDLFWGPAHRLPRIISKNIPLVVTIHDLVWRIVPETMRPITRLLESYFSPKAIGRADYIVADSVATAEALGEYYQVTPGRVEVIPLGAMRADKLQSRDQLKHFGIDRKYALFVGTVEPRKNLQRLLLAYSRLGKMDRDSVMLVIAGGEGWGNVSLKDMVVDLGLESRVRIIDYVSEDVLSMLYANTLFLTMPSLYEGFGLPLAEAIVHGVPVLTSNNSSMPEVAGDAGLLVDALDVDSICAGLEQMINNDELRRDLALNAEKSASRFDWDNSANQLVTIFEKAIYTRGK
jgi:glycosyltransferase involved in cell wall biosynthesis